MSHRPSLRRLFALAIATAFYAGCATATTPDQIAEDDPGMDAGPAVDGAPLIDAAAPDAAPVQVTLSQTTSEMVVDGTAVVCSNSTGTAENSWYRVFDLPALGINSAFAAEKVTMGIEVADANGGTIPVNVRLHTLAGRDLLVANLTELVSSQVQLADQTLTTVDVPTIVSVPPDSVLVVEIFTADLTDTGTGFVLGANSLGQSAEGYIRAPVVGCDFVEPVPTAAAGFPNAHFVLTVTGTH